MPTSAVGLKRCAVSSITSRAQAAISVSPGSRWPAGWLSTRRPSWSSSTNRNLPSRSMTAATVTLGGRQTDTSGHLPGVPPDEIGHARNALLDRLLRSGVREAHVLAFARNARAEMDVGEHRDARLVQQALAELLRIGRAGHAAGLGDVRPGIERAAGKLAAHSGGFI